MVDVGAAANVGDHRKGAMSVSRGLRGCSRGSTLLDINHNHIRTRCRECLGDGSTDATTTTADHEYPEILHDGTVEGHGLDPIQSEGAAEAWPRWIRDR
jgi:hypothetical protein